MILSGRMMFENDKREKVEVGPGDTVYFYENEPHRGIVLGHDPVELICIIDCPDGGEVCIPDKAEGV
jgi:quercetin dioxygenase-like cupin family protein